MPALVRSLTPVLSLGVAGLLFAQEPHHHAPGDKLGEVRFPTSCRPAVQPRFERAMALLHSFWWEQTVAAFGEIAAADPDCAMAHWGLAMAYWNNPFAGGPSDRDREAGAAAAARAAETGRPTPREQAYIAAVNQLYAEHATTSNAARLRGYADAMARVHADYPEDDEAALFYALSLVATASPTDTTLARQRQANAILNPLFERHPEHPGLAHYIIHANDSPALADYGLDAARRYADLAPSVPHAQHMPSHIFIRLGLWEENVEANRRSYQAGADYAAEHFGTALGGHEFHAMDYMVYGYLQLGRDSAAGWWTAHALAATEVVPPGTLISEYARAAMPSRMALERNRWNEAKAVPLPEGPPAARMVGHFARGLGAARTGDLTGARQEAAALRIISRDLAEREPYWSRVAAIKRQAVEAWITLGAGDTTSALAAARAAAEEEEATDKHPVTPGEVLPARELFGDMLLAVGRPVEARRAFEETLRREPGRARAILGAARAAHLAGELGRAAERYQQFLEQMAGADGDRPELVAAREALRSLRSSP